MTMIFELRLLYYTSSYTSMVLHTILIRDILLYFTCPLTQG
jgi:hypothetical protein